MDEQKFINVVDKLKNVKQIDMKVTYSVLSLIKFEDEKTITVRDILNALEYLMIDERTP